MSSGGFCQNYCPAKEPPDATRQYLLTVNPPIPQWEWVRTETFRHFGPIATKMTALEVCFLLRWLARTSRPGQWQIHPHIRFILVYRDPKDVAVSQYFFYCRHPLLGVNPDITLEAFVDSFF
ncbi:MAG: sulfotransferase domain-containing protein [Leptolyngbyaceae cyanobacterium]